MLLTELFNKPMEWEKDEEFSDEDAFSASFQTPGGKSFDVYIHTRAEDPKTYEVEFSDSNERDHKKRFAITGEGDAVAIMSTVLEVVGNFLQNNPDSVLYFSSTEKSRSTLYYRMIKRAVKPPFVSHATVKGNVGVFWIGKPENVKAAVLRDIGEDV